MDKQAGSVGWIEIMPWKVERDGARGLLRLRLEGILGDADMHELVTAHDRAVDDFAGAEYRVFCDIRGLKPLSPASTELFERAKRYSAAHGNFRGSAVLTDSPLAATQHQRTSVAGGVMSTELITQDENACWEHLDALLRKRASRP